MRSSILSDGPVIVIAGGRIMMIAPSNTAARAAAKRYPERFPVGAEIVRIADRAVLAYVAGKHVEPPPSAFDPDPVEACHGDR